MQLAESDMMNPLNASWSILKGGFNTIDLIARECDTMAECLESMKESFPDMDKETAIKYITEAKNNHARENMQSQKPVEIANIMDSKERIQELNPNAENFVDGSAPPVPQNNPNPLDLSMESLKRLNEGR